VTAKKTGTTTNDF